MAIQPSAAKKKQPAKAKPAAAAPNAAIIPAAADAEKSVPESFIKPDNIFRLWLEGWKKAFTLRGRASRYELWSFLWLNSVICVFIELLCCYILSPHFLRAANNRGYTLAEIEQSIIAAKTVFYLCLILPLFPAGALFIRRMHDLNKLAWHGYLEPVFMGVVFLSMVNIAITMLENTDLAYTLILLSICFVAILYSVGFYSLKFLIMALFYRGAPGKNNYGTARFNDAEHEERALNFSCWYFLFIATVLSFWLLLALA